MSESFDNLTGEIIAAGTITAKEGKADELGALLSKSQSLVRNGEEPKTFAFEVARFGSVFALWERYDGPEGVKAHCATPHFDTFKANIGGLAEKVDIKFYTTEQ